MRLEYCLGVSVQYLCQMLRCILGRLLSSQHIRCTIRCSGNPLYAVYVVVFYCMLSMFWYYIAYCLCSGTLYVYVVLNIWM